MTREEAIFILKRDNPNNIAIRTGFESLYDQRKEAFSIAIKALEQEPKTGHWIITSDYLTTAYGSVDYVKCSCCGEDSLEEGDYCPNCGAKMESEDKE